MAIETDLIENKRPLYFTDKSVFFNFFLRYLFRFLFFLFLILIFGILTSKFSSFIPKSWSPNIPYIEMISFFLASSLSFFLLPFSYNFNISKKIKKMGFDEVGEFHFIVDVIKRPTDHEFIRNFFDSANDIGVLYLKKDVLEYSGDQYYFKLPYSELLAIKRVGPFWALGINLGKRIQINFLNGETKVSFSFGDRFGKNILSHLQKNEEIAKRILNLSFPDIYKKKSSKKI